MLKLVCGTGVIWNGHLDVIDGSEPVLPDFSEAMLDASRQTVGEQPNIRFEQIDIQAFPYPDDSFDVVIANMMLYHVPDLHKGLSEARRVLRPGGRFYCATFGERGHNCAIARMLEAYGVSWQISAPFTLQNGEEKMGTHFDRVERVDRADALLITDARDLADYVLSLTGINGIEDMTSERLRAFFEAKMAGGALRLPKEYGLFICQ